MLYALRIAHCALYIVHNLQLPNDICLSNRYCAILQRTFLSSVLQGTYPPEHAPNLHVLRQGTKIDQSEKKKKKKNQKKKKKPNLIKKNR